MSKFSDYLEEKILESTLRGAAFPSISTAYLAIFTADPTDADSATEVNWTGYARQAMSFGASSGGQSSIDAQIQFPALVGSAQTISHIGIYDAASSGNLLYHTNLQNSKNLTEDDVLSFAVGGVTVALD
jgi:hypothetical protein